MFKALIALLPACIVLGGAAILLFREKTLVSILQLVGAACLVLVVLIHFCEALGFLPWMRWGEEGSFGHYLDFGAAIAGLTLFPLGYLLHVVTRR